MRRKKKKKKRKKGGRGRGGVGWQPSQLYIHKNYFDRADCREKEREKERERGKKEERSKRRVNERLRGSLLHYYFLLFDFPGIDGGGKKEEKEGKGKRKKE